jgi:hypothetical protein
MADLINVGSAYDDPDCDRGRPALMKINTKLTELETEIDSIISTVNYIEIGAWNMDSTASKDVSYTVPTGYTLIGYKAFILNDAGTLLCNGLQSQGFNTIPLVCTHAISLDKFTVTRNESDFFDSTDFNDAVMNRGYIVLDLVVIS